MAIGIGGSACNNPYREDCQSPCVDAPAGYSGTHRLHPFWLAVHAEHGVEERGACPGAEDLLARGEYSVLGAAVFVQVD